MPHSLNYYSGVPCQRVAAPWYACYLYHHATHQILGQPLEL